MWDLHKLGGPCIHHGQRQKVSPGPSTCPSVAATIPGACGPVLARKVDWGKRGQPGCIWEQAVSPKNSGRPAPSAEMPPTPSTSVARLPQD